MSSIHVLSGDMNNNYTIVVHTPTPTGNNAAGFAWSAVVVASGLAKTMLSVGTAPGQITQAEHDAIVAGTTLEASFQWQDDPTWTNTQRQTDVTLRAQQLSNDLLARLQSQLRYFGYSQ